MTQHPAVLVLECHRHTLPVLRSLHQGGYRTILGLRPGNRSDRFAAFSRACAETWEHPEFHLSDDFLDRLENFLTERPDIAAIFPVGEDSLSLLVRAARENRLPRTARPVMTDPRTVEICLDKESAYAWATELGLPVGGAETVHRITELYEAVERVGFPCAVKPVGSDLQLTGKKCVFLADRAELDRKFPSWPEGGHERLVVQKRIEGLRHNCIFLARRGKILRYFESRVERTDVCDGTGYGVDVVSVAPSPERQGLCEKIVARLNYEGLGCAQFLVAPDSGESVFLELNPRLDATSALPVRCGMDFPLWAVECVLGREVGGASGYPAGVRCQWLMGDLNGLSDSFRRSPGVRAIAARFGSMIRSLLTARVHATWAFRDPRPCLYLYFLRTASAVLRLSGAKRLIRRS